MESVEEKSKQRRWLPNFKALRLKVYRLADRLNIPLADAARVELEEYDGSDPQSLRGLQKLPRTLYFGLPLPDSELDDTGEAKRWFPRNKIRTAKYTPIDFIPKNIFLQFQNVANLFFLFLVILQVCFLILITIEITNYLGSFFSLLTFYVVYFHIR